ncbi:Gfo/Idh/MocA family protein [Sutcliffiella rhizosphaerae]|uniref:Inositol 2-dehydrogenase/D-chiro-inositol 3-dehydrogenase n=1 Tax=Sutcliffiella rhizosphaerae TaxID=2880967 RepID=A0ABM8YLT5_9BACI|nr:Gfo/Idh/MocA family oxidoreductase [Sutcliffiella rhizosphaerae]CAG9620792.1 Inositol 2-dehydrogenase/D-chiro-inositol 3-dehydrogenase [Sutcliffiella rhizosphaerae]
MEKMKVGIIGTGTISGIYLEAPSKFSILDIVAVADLDLERAKEKAKTFNIKKACTVEELLADPEIEMVINLTIPKAHYEVSMAALEAGKHVFVEKPLAVEVEQGKKIVELAREKGLRVGCAPDTFLGGALQTCRKLIDDGVIGRPIAATGFMLNGGPEGWHPSPDFYYQKGGGPMFDMGPYYLTAFIHLLGPVKRVTGSAQSGFPERTVTRSEDYGRKLPVETPTHVAGILDFENGAVGTLITSFDVMGGTQLPSMEIYGTKGTLSVPDPNNFGGVIRVRKTGEHDFNEVPLSYGYSDNSRGIGAADMAHAITIGRAHRANGEMALQVLEIMHAIHEASLNDKHMEIEHKCQRPNVFPVGLNQSKQELFTT